MAQSSIKSPLLGYNTNVRHAGHLFHIQTEDSGRGHPHVITHLFTEGTILSSKKTSYDDCLEKSNWEEIVRQLMKDQHKSMFVELRDGVHDEIASKILGRELSHDADVPEEKARVERRHSILVVQQGGEQSPAAAQVKVIEPAAIDKESTEAASRAAPQVSSSRGMSIFESADSGASFGETLISDKSLDDVILTYLGDELDE